jgi:hypothetical protein
MDYMQEQDLLMNFQTKIHSSAPDNISSKKEFKYILSLKTWHSSIMLYCLATYIDINITFLTTYIVPPRVCLSSG